VDVEVLAPPTVDVGPWGAAAGGGSLALLQATMARAIRRATRRMAHSFTENPTREGVLDVNVR
jgi:hypothetical protein